MSNFYDFMHANDENSLESCELPIAKHVNKTASHVQASNARQERMYDTAMCNIEKMKQQLYEKIDVCCAQYGLYGLKVIDKAITDSLRAMINGVQTQPVQQPVYQQPQQPVYQQPVQEAYQPVQYQQNVEQKQPRQIGEEMLANSFMNNIDAILSECDKDSEKRAEEQMKQRLLEQKQVDIIIAQNVNAARQDANADLSKHENDYTEIEQSSNKNV